MMIRGSSSKEAGDSQVDAKNSDEKKKKSCTIGSNSCSTSSWHRLKDPRIVRVSRAFGGKDRHSKVCTVRGLRDRRVRLSVPTAIQLYDLQDRLGLSQPSKVVDWLLNAAKDEIDELPPLQMPPLGFPNHQQPTQQQQPNKEQLVVEAVPSLYQWEPNSFPLSYMGFMMSQSQDARHANTSIMQPSTLSLSSGSHPDHFPLLENNTDPRLQMQMLHHMRPNFQLSKDQQHHHFPDSK